MSSIDVVIPCYRYGRYLRECVNSVLAQEVPGLRVLIIDDASPDETPEVALPLAREDRRVTYRRHPVNFGHIRTYNEGIEWASADCMLLLSADDLLLPGALQRGMALMQSEPRMSLCFGQVTLLLDDGVRRSGVPLPGVGSEPRKIIEGDHFVRLCIEAGANNIVPTPTAIVRTRLLKQSGSYRADLPHSADLEMWLRLAAHGSVGMINDMQAVYRRHSSNMSLAYQQDGCLGDLRQRRAAFDVFRQQCAHLMPDMHHLHAALLRRLAAEAVGYASAAYSDGRPEVSANLRAFALAVDPRQRYTSRWARLAMKRVLGQRMSQALLPWFGRSRAAVRPRG